MALQTQKFQKQPLIVDAVRVTADNFVEVANWCQGEITNNDGTPGVGTPFNPTAQHIHVRVHNPMNERQTKAFVGDWILYAGRGYKVYKDRSFKNTFVPVDMDVEKAKEAIALGDDVAEEALEMVPATPEGIAQAVAENDAARAMGGTTEPIE